MTQGILGLRGQGVGRPTATAAPPARYQVSFNAPYTAGNQTWTCPRTGEYSIYAWGPGGVGGSGNPGGGSGSLAIWQRARFLAGDVVTISIPSVAASTSVSQTTVSTPRKAAVLTAGGGATGTGVGGVAANGDVNINGSSGATPGTAGGNGGGTDGGLGVSASGGAGAPGYDGFHGGDAATATAPGSTPGGGGAGSGTASNPQFWPGQGLVIICRDS